MIQEKIAAEAEAKIQAEEEMQVQRKLDSKELAGETIRRELAESGSTSRLTSASLFLLTCSQRKQVTSTPI